VAFTDKHKGISEQMPRIGFLIVTVDALSEQMPRIGLLHCHCRRSVLYTFIG